MHRKSFKNVKDHSLIIDDGWFNAMYKDKIDDHLGMEAEISFLKQPDSIDVLLTNLYYPNMRQGTREQDDQQTVFKLSKENVPTWQDPGATPGALITSICNLQVLFLYSNLEGASHGTKRTN